MSTDDFKNLIIPALRAFVGVPVIRADQMGGTIDGPHMTYKLTTPYGQERGQAEEKWVEVDGELILTHTESFRRVVSFSAYAMDDEVSIDLAQSARDWFNFAGYEFLSANNVVLVEATSVANRDVFVLEDYDRRNGFDATLRFTRVSQAAIDYYDGVNGITEPTN